MVSGPQFDRNRILRLLKAKEDKKLAEEAQLMANEQKQTITPPSQEIIEQAKAPTPNSPTPLDNPNIFARFGSKIMDVLETEEGVAVGTAIGMFDSDFRKRRRELQSQTKEQGLKDYFAATKQAYKEKNLPLWASLPLSLALSPSTYIPLGLPFKALGIGSKVAKGVQGATKVTATMKFDDAIKAADRVIIDKPLDDLATDSIDKGNLGILSTIQEYAKGKGVNLDVRNATDRGLMKYINIGYKIDSIASANGHKVNSIKNWNKFLDADEGIIKGTGTSLDNQSMFSALEDVFDVDKFVKGTATPIKIADGKVIDLSKAGTELRDRVVAVSNTHLTLPTTPYV